jgi:hypothetical protein
MIMATTDPTPTPDLTDQLARVLLEWDAQTTWEHLDDAYRPAYRAQANAVLAWLAERWITVTADITGTVVHEWRVIGDPGPGFPPYDFTWRSEGPEPSENEAEQNARTFLTLIGETWNRPPSLAHRTVTYSPWEDAEA